MKVILLADIQGQGKKGDIVAVNDGYARNYLLPKKLAAEATKSVLNEIEQKLAKEARLLREERAKAEAVADRMRGTTVAIYVRCGDGKMYGSVTTQDVADALAKEGFEVDKKKITVKDSIKSVGVYDADVKIYKDISVKIKIDVRKAE